MSEKSLLKMLMSKRPSWMPDAMDVRLRLYNAERREVALYQTGIRAQIAALEEIALNAPCAECVSYECVKAKLAALRKELP